MVVVVYSGHRAVSETSAIRPKSHAVSETWRVAARRCHSMRGEGLCHALSRRYVVWSIWLECLILVVTNPGPPVGLGLIS